MAADSTPVASLLAGVLVFAGTLTLFMFTAGYWAEPLLCPSGSKLEVVVAPASAHADDDVEDEGESYNYFCVAGERRVDVGMRTFAWGAGLAVGFGLIAAMVVVVLRRRRS